MTESASPHEPVTQAGGKRIAIIGGGLMGSGIAHVFLVAGHDVAIFEPDPRTREGLQRRLAESLVAVGADEQLAVSARLPDSLAETVDDASFVFEAAPEKLNLKRAIFVDIEACAPQDAILASNSSVIPITNIAAGLATAHRAVGTHWWNPAHLIPLVEVVQGEATSNETVAATMALLSAAGKVPAHIRKDVPGFVANRLQHALWREAVAMVAEGICDAATVDTCVKNSFGLRLPVLGPLENADLVGLDLTLDIHRTIIPELDRHAGPHEFLVEMVERGMLGFKTGEGFQTWSPTEQDALRRRLVNFLVGVRHNVEQASSEGPIHAR